MSGFDVYVKHLDRLEPEERDKLIARLRSPSPDCEFIGDERGPRLHFDNDDERVDDALMIRAQTLIQGLSQQLGIAAGVVAVDRQ